MPGSGRSPPSPPGGSGSGQGLASTLLRGRRGRPEAGGDRGLPGAVGEGPWAAPRTSGPGPPPAGDTRPSASGSAGAEWRPQPRPAPEAASLWSPPASLFPAEPGDWQSRGPPSGFPAVRSLVPLRDGGGGGRVAGTGVREAAVAADGAGQERCVAARDGDGTGPGGEGSVAASPSGLLETPHTGELQGSFGEAGGQGVTVGSHGPSGAGSTGSFLSCAGPPWAAAGSRGWRCS